MKIAFNPTQPISTRLFQTPRINTNLKGIVSAGYFGSIFLKITPIKLRIIKKFETPKTEMRKWKPTKCSFR